MSTKRLPDLECLCGTLRRTARALTQLYEETLRSTGLKATQLTILQVLSRAGEIPQGRLGEILAMDSTTLTRTLRIMHRHGWVAERRGTDRRERWLRLSETGKAQLDRALPEWQKIQTKLERQLGTERWRNLLHLANETTETVNGLGGGK
jgi:DNA-binding MarR family transcriptional regulator